MRRFALLLAACVLPGLSMADEGMWTMDNPPLDQMKKSLGFAPDAAWFEHVMHGAARLAGGCSASFVSADGLVLSNHHCVAECVSQLSSDKKDYLKDGFVARERKEEAACPAMEINRLEKITDVTEQVKAATAGKAGIAFKQAQNAIRAKLSSACVGTEGTKVRCDVVDLYHGGQYKLYRYHRFQDVRLVFAPEQSIAFFGGDPDNFNFPRFDLDMSLVRVYEDGKPVHVTDYFPINAQGPAAGEAVFVVGNPGSTQRSLTVAQLSALRDYKAPSLLFRLYEKRGVMEQFRTQGDEQARIANADLFYIENSIKARKGQFETLVDPKLFEQKKAQEASLRQFVNADPKLKATTAHAWDEIAAAEAALRNFYLPYRHIEGGLGFESDYFQFARLLVRAATERAKPNAERLPEYNDSALPQLEAHLFSEAPIYPAYEKVKLGFALTKMREDLGTDDAFVQQVLGKESPAQLAARLIDATHLGELATRKALWQGGLDAITQSTDPFIQLALAVDPKAREIRRRFEAEYESRVQKNSELIAQAHFAQARSTVYPDATFTMRLSYGTVKGWKEGERQIEPFTNFAGAFQRATGSAPYALTQAWLDAKDHIKLDTPLNFVTNNDIIGGNSGSPMLNKKGELVGLIFDGNIHSLGGAFWFDGTLNRAVAVDSAGILEAMDKIYHAGALRDELAGSH